MKNPTFKDIQEIAKYKNVSIERYKTSRNLYVVSFSEQESVIVKCKLRLIELFEYLTHNSFEDLVANCKATDAEIEKYEAKHRPTDFKELEKKIAFAFELVNGARQSVARVDAEIARLDNLIKQAKGEETIKEEDRWHERDEFEDYDEDDDEEWEEASA